jgi:hypothetical protein
MTMPRGLHPLLVGVIAVAALACGLSAHEIGTTRVSAAFDPDHTYNIQVLTDAAALVDKLEAVADEPATTPSADAAALERRLHELQQIVPSRVVVAFGDAAVYPDVHVSVVPATGSAPPVAVVTFSGTVPSDATRFTWRYGWTFASYALTVRTHPGDDPATTWLEGGQTSQPVSLVVREPRSTWPHTARRYLALGFTHIIPLGPDHVLFVLGLFLLNSRPRTLLTQVSAFTVAHSITLGMSMYGLVAVPARIVEPAIAVSIAYVAVENLLISELKSWRVWLVFACGLLHGLGFAGVLHELGLPRREFLTALLSFNVGVEAAQLAVIAAAFLVVGAWFAGRTWYRTRIVMPASAAIACTALVWAVQRLQP